jgi:hypothetical protein
MKFVALAVFCSTAAATVVQLGCLPSEAREVPASCSSARFGEIVIAQGGRGARDDGAAARSDALMGTPNKKTPVLQDNLFSTSPRLEQQPPAAEPPGSRGATPAPQATPR